jgi:hypothetical protein
VRVRTFFMTVLLLAISLGTCSALLAAQNSPVPFVNNPLVPAAVVPGGPGFTLTVNGAGFVNGAVVKWNGSPRTTTFVSNTKLTASIPASDLATATTIPVTVANPGGGASNAVLFEVTTPITSLAFNRTDSDFSNSGNPGIHATSSLAVGYLPLGPQPYLEVASSGCPAGSVCILDHGYIGGSSETLTVSSPVSVVTGDFNGDGIFDLISLGSSPTDTFSVSLAITTSGFNNPKAYPLPVDSVDNSTPAVGDFNCDGHLDLVVAATAGVYFFPGNGDGTFGTPVFLSTDTSAIGTYVVAGDFNGDGNLDLAVSNVDLTAGSVSILLGNGDGTFQPHADYPTGPLSSQIVSADFNGDSNLDLGVIGELGTAISILLGKGDGTFQSKVDYPAGVSLSPIALGDFNGDGIIDVAVTDELCTSSGCSPSGSVNVLLGNGDGTFKSHLDFATAALPGAVATGEFNYFSSAVGRQGFAGANPQDNTVSIFSAILTGTVTPLPTISSISPLSTMVNSGAFTITVTGTNFVTGSTVYFGGQPHPTIFVSATQLTAAIQANDVGNIGGVSVFVVNPAPGGGDSTSITFSVFGPPPTVSSLSPSSVVAAGPAFTLTVNGLNFVAGAIVNFNGTPRTTTFVSTTQLTIAISAGDITNQGTVNISATNPAVNGNGGGTSSSLLLTILPTNTQPVVGALVPASTTAGGPAFTLLLTGNGFTANTIVTFNSSVVSSAFVSPTELQAAIPPSAIAVGGTPLVTAANPGGSPSIVVTFTVNNPVPGENSLSPSSLPVGNAAATINVSGTNFNASSKVLVNGNPRATTFVSATSLNAALLASDLAQSGTLNVTVINPAPAGGVTSPMPFVVGSFSLNAQTPATSIPAGQAATFSLTFLPATITTTNPVTFATGPLPTGATASFSPATIPAGSGPTTVMLSISTMPHSVSAKAPPRGSLPRPNAPFFCWIIVMMALMACGLSYMTVRARRFAPQLLTASVLIIAASLAACGGSSSSNTSGTTLNPATGTPAGTYPIGVTASSSSGSVTTTVTLTVI